MSINPVSPESVSEAFLEKELPIVDTPESLLPDIDLAETHQLTLAEYDSHFPLETDFISSYERKMYIIDLYDRIDETCLSIVEKCGRRLRRNSKNRFIHKSSIAVGKTMRNGLVKFRNSPKKRAGLMSKC